MSTPATNPTPGRRPTESPREAFVLPGESAARAIPATPRPTRSPFLKNAIVYPVATDLPAPDFAPDYQI